MKKAAWFNSFQDARKPVSINVRCAGCPMAEVAQGFVKGEGPIGSARVWVVGQGPGWNEMVEGRPFMQYAPSGRYLDGALKLAGVRREDVYITNARKCLPPLWRKLMPDEDNESMACCAKYLDEEMAQGKPNVILTLGAPAFQRLTGRKELIKKFQGSVFRAEELGDERLPTTALP